jgi:nicotinamidase-related amidase
VKDALLVVDVFNDFEHEDGDALLASFRKRLPGMRTAIASARMAGIPVVYVNDHGGRWDGDAPAIVSAAQRMPHGGDLAARLAPDPGDPFILKPRYSAFDHTPLELLLRELGVERLLIAGAATEGCVVQTGIDARELGLKVTILADACATNDPELEELSLRYAEQVGGMQVARESAGAGLNVVSLERPPLDATTSA